MSLVPGPVGSVRPTMWRLEVEAEKPSQLFSTLFSETVSLPESGAYL